MDVKPVRSYSRETLTDFSEYPAQTGDSTGMRTAAPVIVPSALTLMEDRKSSHKHSGMMPNDWLLEKPGVKPYADLNSAQADARLILERLFIGSYNLVMIAGEHLVQKRVAILDRKTRVVAINEQGGLSRIGDEDAAGGTVKKASHLSRLIRWVAIEVTAVACLTGRASAAEGLSPAAIALCGYYLADALFEEPSFMEKAVQEMVRLLQEMGFNEKSSNLIAHILISVASMMAMMALPGDEEESCSPEAIIAIAGNMTEAIQMAEKYPEATGDATCLTDNFNCVVDGLRNKEGVPNEAGLPGINEATQSLEDQVIDFVAFINDETKGYNSLREDLFRCIQDIITSTRELIDQGTSH